MREMPSRATCSPFVAAALLLLASAIPCSGEETEKEKPAPPTALLAVPLVLERGQTTRCAIRGQRLDTVKTVTADKGASVAVVSEGEAKPPDGWKPEQIGDRQIVCDISIPDAFPPDAHALSLSLETAEGDTATISIEVATPGNIVDEKEPNPGFRDAQDITPGRVVRGAIAAGNDNDVFQFDANADSHLEAAVTARQLGSALDPILTLFDANGFERARSDDAPSQNRDARISLPIPATGRYFLVLQDAHDSGSDAHVYRLSLTLEKR